MKVALLGNPNAGKTSIFNYLTGMNQKVGNFPGVTIEKKVGTCHLPNQQKVSITDLPGTYSLYPKSLEEEVVLEVLLDKEHPEHPDLLVVVVDASNLKRNLLLFTQLHDLGIPTILVFNLIDAAKKAGLHFDKEVLEKAFNTTIVFTNARTEEGLATLEQQLTSPKDHRPTQSLWSSDDVTPALLKEVQEKYKLKNTYWALLLIHHFEKLSFLSEENKNSLERLSLQHGFKSLPAQSKETVQRYELINEITTNSIKKKEGDGSEVVLNKELDILFLHPVGGYLIFFSILFLMFQAIYTIADYPIQWIEQLFAWVGTSLNEQLPDTPLTDLFTDGILAGIGGVVVFVPQIAILFGIIAILEETGYMTRVMLLMDKLMQKFGLNGRSVVPLISGIACAIPAIMSARNIDNWKERFITIMVTPLMSCSARLPIYTVIIGLVIPKQQIAGIFDLRGLVLMGLYLLGLAMALIVAFVFKFIVKAKGKSYFIMELPNYRIPRWKNVGMTMYEKSKTFVWEAGKIIVLISVVLWILAYYSPDGSRTQIADEVKKDNPSLSTDELANKIASVQLEQSYAGHLGRVIEPVVAPLGYDWRIGIALITSFAAREVFVGTMATIYSIGSEDELTVTQHLARAKDPVTGEPMYTLALGASLLIFYAFAMQCMSTLAVVQKETKSWKYPILQFVYMTVLAYVAAWATYNVLS